jgi:2'-5' RNA ligase
MDRQATVQMIGQTDASSPASWPRCFIALAPDAATRRLMAGLPAMADARQVHLDDLHLTLAFVGAISDTQRQVLTDALPDLAALASPLPPLESTGLEAWPTEERARVWVATFALPDALRQLVDRVHEIVTAASLPVERRPFRPHITVARFAKGGISVDAQPALPAHVARVEGIGLYTRQATPRSGPDGPHYVALASRQLG